MCIDTCLALPVPCRTRSIHWSSRQRLSSNMYAYAIENNNLQSMDLEKKRKEKRRVVSDYRHTHKGKGNSLLYVECCSVTLLPKQDEGRGLGACLPTFGHAPIANREREKPKASLFPRPPSLVPALTTRTRTCLHLPAPVPAPAPFIPFEFSRTTRHHNHNIQARPHFFIHQIHTSF